jgi:hypothetical protein
MNFLGFRRNGPTFLFVRMRIPFGNGKLAQERSALAQKRNPMNFLGLRQEFIGGASMLRSVKPNEVRSRRRLRDLW